MIESPIVTIAVPFYNEEKYLRQTLQSLVDQTIKNAVFILSDNNSNDGSFEIASEFARKDSRIKLIKHDVNIGAVGNFVYTRDIAETKYFMWLGAHDCVKDNFVELAVQFLEQNNQVVLYYPKAKYFEQIETLLESADSEIESKDVLPVERMMKVVTQLANCTAIHGVFRTDVIKKIPFEKIGADNLVLFLMASYGLIEASPDTKYFRRVVRKETQEEFVARMKKYGMGKADTMIQYRVEVYQVHFKHLFNNINLNFQEKMELFYRLRDLCLYRYPKDFTRLALLKYFLFKNVDLKVAFILPLAYLFEFQQLSKRKLRQS